MKIEIDFELTPRAQRAVRWLLLPALTVVCLAGIAHATLDPAPSAWIRAGSPVSSSSLTLTLTNLDNRIALRVRGGSANERMVRAYVTHDGAAKTCAVARTNDKWIQTALVVPYGGDAGGGDPGGCTLPLVTDYFAEAPVCVCSANEGADRMCSVIVNAASSLVVIVKNADKANVATPVHVICMGSGPDESAAPTP